jgi:glutathione S-transferase
MAKPKLTYFDAPISRGEECRLALHLAGVDFEDVRIKRSDWPALKPTTPYGAVPVLEIPGHPPIAHANAILVLVGRLHGMHPEDPYEAALHEGMMVFVEELRGHVSPILRIKDEAEKIRVRTELATDYLPQWAGWAERNLGDGPFFAGDKVHVVDIKLFGAVRWFASGTVDHVPPTVFAKFPKLTRLYEAMRDHAGVKAWQAKH